MKPVIYRLGSKWFCAIPFTLEVGFGYSPVEAYANWRGC